MNDNSTNWTNKSKEAFLNKIKGITTFLNDSNNYWASTINDFKKCSIGTENAKKVENKLKISFHVDKQTKEIEDVNDLSIQNPNKCFETSNKLNIPFLKESLLSNEDECTTLPSKDTSCRNSFNNKYWTREDDDKLITLVQKYGKKWGEISNVMKSKSKSQCLYRYRKILDESNKIKWYRNDDILLLELIELYDENWEYISTKMPGRTPNDVQHRYLTKLIPNLKTLKFSNHEDELLLKLHKKYGNKWKIIAKHFPNRNATLIKNRYYSFLKKKNESNLVHPIKINPVNHSENSLVLNKNEKNNSITMDIISKPNLKSIEDDIFMSNNLNKNIYLDDIEDDNLKNWDVQNIDRFDEEYNNIFECQKRNKDSFDFNFMDQFYVNNESNENENLLKQYQTLDTVFRKVNEVSNLQKNLTVNNTIENNLEIRKEELSYRLRILRDDYINIINSTQNNELIKHSLFKQIEVLIDLIKTIKMKIKIIQDFEDKCKSV